MSVNVQYVGFTAKPMVREYSFLARESSIDSHEITFTILNEAIYVAPFELTKWTGHLLS
jgi:hypothetical protein